MCLDDSKLKSAPVDDIENCNELIPSLNKSCSSQKQVNGNYKIKNELLNHCWKLWHSTVITWDGKIVPCCFDKDAQHQLGDLNSKIWQKIGRGVLYNSFRWEI